MRPHLRPLRNARVTKIDKGDQEDSVMQSRMAAMKESIKRFLQDEDGATMVEYAIMAAFIAAVCYATVSTLGIKVLALFTSVQF